MIQSREMNKIDGWLNTIDKYAFPRASSFIISRLSEKWLHLSIIIIITIIYHETILQRQ